MTQKLSEENIKSLLATTQYPDIDPTTWEGAAKIIRQNQQIKRNKPQVTKYDKLDEEYITYCNSRAERPHTNGTKNKVNDCPICKGDTTPILMKKDSYPTPFINLNLFPFAHPDGIPIEVQGVIRDRMVGANFLLWPTSDHKEIHQLTNEENAASFSLLADFEKTLGNTIKHNEKNYKGYFQVMKNTGKEAGGSLEHGHYQIAFINKIPPLIKKDRSFLEKEKISVAEYLNQYAQQNSSHVIKEYDNVQIITSPYAKKPLDITILPKKPGLEKLKDADGKTLEELSNATADVARALYSIMPAYNKPYAHNMIFHTGEDIGTLYIQFLLPTQTRAGFEECGVSVCQLDTESAAKIYKNTFRHQETKKPKFSLMPSKKHAAEIYDLCIAPIVHS